MPIDALLYPDTVRVSGSLTVINDPGGNAGNVNVQGGVTASGTSSFANISGSFPSAASIAGGLIYDSIVGSIPATTVTQSVPVASGSLITMTGSGRIIRVSCSALTTSTSLTPTASTLTNSTFSNGQEVTLLNVAIGGSNISIAAVGTGAAYVLVGLTAARFMYVADLQTWVHMV